MRFCVVALSHAHTRYSNPTQIPVLVISTPQHDLNNSTKITPILTPNNTDNGNKQKTTKPDNFTAHRVNTPTGTSGNNDGER